ncbi:MAG: NADP-dependent phosphogluconate dehydrogenase [Thiolinea sp.]
MSFQPRIKSQIGLIGVGVMGSNLAQNIHEKGFRINVYDRDENLRQRFSEFGLSASEIHATFPGFVASLTAPRCILVMIKAGDPVDQVINHLLPLLTAGDLIVDLGNSHFQDTERRAAKIKAAGFRYIGCGVSGGAEGARHGPAMMPGGDLSSWQQVKEVFEATAAVYEGEPCANWTGNGGAGHFVKMTHNGIEYADMQLIAEAYQLMRFTLGMDVASIATQFERWNQGSLQSYLLEISVDILRAEEKNGDAVIDHILDRAGQKGTGSWSTHVALDYGVPTTMITSAVMARVVSSFKTEREVLAAQTSVKAVESPYSDTQILADIEQALYGAKIIAYAQGYQLMKAASTENDWGLDLAAITRSWRAGCIIRGNLLNKLLPVLANEPESEKGLLGSHLIATLSTTEQETALRRVVLHGLSQATSLPCLSAALSYLDSIRTATLSANMIQAQRDYFGSHGFQRIGEENEGLQHFDW